MLHKNVPLTRAASAIVFIGLVTLTVIVVFAMVTQQFVGLPIVLLLLVAWGGMFLLQVILPIIAVIQLLVWLNRQLFCLCAGCRDPCCRSLLVRRLHPP